MATLSISEEKFTKDSRDRNVTTLTNFFYSSCTYDLLNGIEEILIAEENDEELRWSDENGDRYEITGKLLNKVLEKYPEIKINGEVDPETVYEVEFLS